MFHNCIGILDVDFMLTHTRGFKEYGRVKGTGIVVLHIGEWIFVVVGRGALFTPSGSGERAEFTMLLPLLMFCKFFYL
jgi:hypothetical protein